jgi:Domain of unknown function (DUF6306)
MAMLTPETIYSLNALLEEERASVHSAVALAGGATEYVEREAFSMMGREDVEICVALRERLSQAHISPSRAVSEVAEAILAAEQYDDRLRAFAEHQRAVSQRAGELAQEVADAAAREILERLSELHLWHALWAGQRADDFAATRYWENGRMPREGQGGARMDSGAGLPDGISADPGSKRGSQAAVHTDQDAAPPTGDGRKTHAEPAEQALGLDASGSATSGIPTSETEEQGHGRDEGER